MKFIKLCILGALLSGLVSATALANETHSPQYKCSHSSSEKSLYLLIGNDFPQTGDLDWSKEVILATAEEYLNGREASNMVFKAANKIGETFRTLPQEIIVGILEKTPSPLKGTIHLELEKIENTADYIFKMIMTKPAKLCPGKNSECEQVREYNCVKQGWVDKEN